MDYNVKIDLRNLLLLENSQDIGLSVYKPILKKGTVSKCKVNSVKQTESSFENRAICRIKFHLGDMWDIGINVRSI